jgi:circadian clock protein KaiC
LLFAYNAARQGRKVLVFSFDESLRVLRARAEGVGLNLGRLEKAGTLIFQRVDPAELTPGQFAHLIKAGVEQNDVEVVLIDSLNGYIASMPDEKFLSLHLHELLAYLGQSGVITLFTLAQAGMIGQMNSPADITYLADTVVLLRFFECDGAVKKAISVIKKRTSRHEETIRELTFEPQGLRVGKALKEFRGILTGVPVYLGGNQEANKHAAN